MSDQDAIRAGVFVSDLHLFSSRSDPSKLPPHATKQRPSDECVVLGGDIFDFKWSQLGGLGSTINIALGWLQELLEKTGDGQIIYLPGNHDCHPEFLKRLEDLSASQARFSMHEHHCQIGDCLFLHGDILDSGIEDGGLSAYRRKFHHIEPKPAVLHRCYDAAVFARVHKVVPSLLHRPNATCTRLLSAVDALEVLDRSLVRKIFFGHTHVAIDGLVVGATTFHNPGAALKHVRFQASEFKVQND